MHSAAKRYIRQLKLESHPEGGYFKEIYRSGEIFSADNLPKRYKGNRAFSTSIYFLLDEKQISAFHRLKSDETWHFYDGESLRIHIIDTNGKLSKIVLGKNLLNDEKIQFTIKKNCWFAAELINKKSFALVGCSVSPGFDFEDFEFGNRNFLIKKYPEFKSIILKLTKELQP